MSELLASLRNGAWLDAQEFPALDYAVPGVLPEGMALLVGPPKAGKSWMVLGFALAIASGGRALGQLDVDKRPVLYLALEDGDRRLQDRCRKLLKGQPIPPYLQYLTRIENGMLTDTIAEWLNMQHGNKPFVILDTLGKALPPAAAGESAYSRDYRIGGALKRLVDDHPGSTLLVNHHDRKATSEDFVDAVSGTNGLAGAADTILVLARQRTEQEGILKVTGRDVFESEYAVTFESDAAWTLNGETLNESAFNAAKMSDTNNLGERSSEMIEAVAAYPDGATAGQVAKDLGLNNAKNVGTYLARLVDSGKLTRLRRGRYAYKGRVESVESVESSSVHTPDSTLSTDSTLRCIRCGELVDPVLGYHPGCTEGTA